MKRLGEFRFAVLEGLDLSEDVLSRVGNGDLVIEGSLNALQLNLEMLQFTGGPVHFHGIVHPKG